MVEAAAVLANQRSIQESNSILAAFVVSFSHEENDI